METDGLVCTRSLTVTKWQRVLFRTTETMTSRLLAAAVYTIVCTGTVASVAIPTVRTVCKQQFSVTRPQRLCFIPFYASLRLCTFLNVLNTF